ncbi:hypothetical protein HLB25_21220 [Dickeya dadantii]|uniref:TrfB-related DNA-binding protein n=1 Tax=Dickeya dadantii TaxID=204038 RepID=UPI001495EE68|nr:TrfB-related DNA-binding protein [Dickeya dadantii]NPE56588.1 hypothetical protein [Dickeya dadantii]NPE69034.1 hypothetical protein [Dickeya dadantii]
MSKRRLSKEEWELSASKLRYLTLSTIDAARMILVDGERQVDVAEKLNTSKQNVYRAVKEVLKRIDSDGERDGMMRVEVWLPVKEAKEVIALAEKYKNKSGGNQI